MELDDAVEELEPLSFFTGAIAGPALRAVGKARALAVRAVRILLRIAAHPFEKDFQTLKEDLRRKPEVKHHEKVF